MKRIKSPLGMLGLTSELLREKSPAEIWQAMQDMQDSVHPISGNVRMGEDGRPQYKEFLQEVSEKAKDFAKEKRGDKAAEESAAEEFGKQVTLSDSDGQSAVDH